MNPAKKLALLLVPRTLRKWWQEEAKEKRATRQEKIPKWELQPKHVENARLLADREQLLAVLPRGAVCAEIGVNKGQFSERILEINSPSKLHLIDAWGDEKRYHDGLKLEVNEKFQKEIAEGRVEINVGLSTAVLPAFPDVYFDWVYLDTAHTYSVTAAELAILQHKVKQNGIIAGHDYCVGNWVGGVRYGVIEAVHELCVRADWEIIFQTAETQQPRSFAIRRIQPQPA